MSWRLHWRWRHWRRVVPICSLLYQKIGGLSSVSRISLRREMRFWLEKVDFHSSAFLIRWFSFISKRKFITMIVIIRKLKWFGTVRCENCWLDSSGQKNFITTNNWSRVGIYRIYWIIMGKISLANKTSLHQINLFKETHLMNFKITLTKLKNYFIDSFYSKRSREIIQE